MSIGTHSGSFQADEALGVWMLRRLSRFGGPTAIVVRTRDPANLEPLPVVIDVGGVYAHDKFRYAHHQRGFYKHWGRDVICALHPQLKSGTPDLLEWVYKKQYKVQPPPPPPRLDAIPTHYTNHE